MRPGPLFLALLGLSAIVHLPGLLIGPSLDAGVFAQVATEVRFGATFYVDVWDHKPPGTYLLLAALQVTMPFAGAWAVSWGASVVAVAGTAFAVTLTCRRLGVSTMGAAVAGVAGVLAMGQYLVSLGGGLTEPLAALPLAASVVLAASHEPVTARRAAAIGLLLGISALISLQVAPGALAVAGLVVLSHAAGRRAAAFAALVAGGSIPVLLVLGWLAWVGALGGAVDAIVGYAAAYRSIASPGGGRLFSPVAAWTVLSLVFLKLPALFGLPRAFRAAGRQRAMAWTALAWIGLSVAFFVYQGRFYAHYVVLLVIPLAILAGFGLDRLAGDLRRLRSPVARAAVALPVLLGVAISLPAAFASANMEADPLIALNRSSRAVAAETRSSTDEGARIWVWGNAPQVYLEADRRQATAFPFMYPLTTPGYSSEERIREVLADLEADPPAVIVDAGSRAVGAQGFAELLEPRETALEGRDLDILDPLRDFVRERYELQAVVEGWPIYRLR